MSSWKKVVIFIVSGAGLLLVGYSWGRWAAPDKVVVTEKVVTVEKQVVVTQTKTEVQKVYMSQTDKKLHKVETEVKHPDGTEEKTTTTDENVDTVVHDQQIKYVDRWNERVTEKEVYKDREKLVYRDRPQWSLGVGAGFSLPEATGRTPGYRLLDQLGPIILNGEVDRRILGPFSAGVWGTTSGEIGLKVRLDW